MAMLGQNPAPLPQKSAITVGSPAEGMLQELLHAMSQLSIIRQSVGVIADQLMGVRPEDPSKIEESPTSVYAAINTLHEQITILENEVQRLRG